MASDDFTHAIDPALELEYNLRARHPERSAVYAGQAVRSAALRERVTGYRAVRYGEGARCLLDLLPAANPVSSSAPLFVFIHGGFWRALDRSIFTFLAEPWLDRGIHCAFVGYDLVPDVPVAAIEHEVAESIAWLLRQSPSLGVDADRIIIAGHSAGAHLGAGVLDGVGNDTYWHAAAFIGLSGVYDLVPLLHTNVNADIRLSAAEARALSPRWRSAERPTQHLLAVGGAETDGFKAQSIDFTRHLQSEGCAAASLIVDGRTHFDILDAFADPSSELFKRAHGLVG